MFTLSAGLLLACTGHSDSSSTFSDGTPWSISDCGRVGSGGGFAGPPAATPQEALNKYAAHIPPGNAPIPTTGWQVLRQRPVTVEFKSGKDLVLVTKVGDMWKLTDYAVCVKQDVPTFTVSSS